MKRRLTVKASDGLVSVDITVQITTRDLVRDEVEVLRHELADKLMLLMPGLTYTRFQLHEVTVQ